MKLKELKSIDFLLTLDHYVHLSPRGLLKFVWETVVMVETAKETRKYVFKLNYG